MRRGCGGEPLFLASNTLSLNFFVNDDSLR